MGVGEDTAGERHNTAGERPNIHPSIEEWSNREKLAGVSASRINGLEYLLSSLSCCGCVCSFLYLNGVTLD